MRGASALQKVFETYPDAPIRAYVVWEPVLRTDFAPPLTRVLLRVGDRRAVQYWDPGRVLSGLLARTEACREGESAPDVVWDWVAIFPRGARWEVEAPEPVWSGGAVVRVAADLRDRLAAELGIREQVRAPSGPATGQDRPLVR